MRVAGAEGFELAKERGSAIQHLGTDAAKPTRHLVVGRDGDRLEHGLGHRVGRGVSLRRPAFEAPEDHRVEWRRAFATQGRRWTNDLA